MDSKKNLTKSSQVETIFGHSVNAEDPINKNREVDEHFHDIVDTLKKLKEAEELLREITMFRMELESIKTPYLSSPVKVSAILHCD
jgi:hypothetical protein